MTTNGFTWPKIWFGFGKRYQYVVKMYRIFIYIGFSLSIFLLKMHKNMNKSLS